MPGYEQQPLPLVFDVAGTAAHLHVRRELVYRLIADGSLHAVKIGRHWRIRREDIEALLAGEVA